MSLEATHRSRRRVHNAHVGGGAGGRAAAVQWEAGGGAHAEAELGLRTFIMLQHQELAVQDHLLRGLDRGDRMGGQTLRPRHGFRNGADGLGRPGSLNWQRRWRYKARQEELLHAELPGRRVGADVAEDMQQ